MSVTFSTSRPARFTGLFLLYAAQGVPEGLLYIAVPAWLAAHGATAEAIGGYIAIILLPWSLKLFNGALMDRFSYLPMGRRRPWLIAAQAALVVSLIAFGSGAPDASHLGFITATGFLVNLAAAFQDVAIDGMAIDVLPASEAARANGLMWGGKSLGIAGASALTSVIISNSGFADAAITTAAFVAAVMAVPLFVRERPEEKLAPWSEGRASKASLDRQLTRWRPIVSSLFNAMKSRVSLMLSGGIFLALAGYGVNISAGSVLAVQELGWSEGAYGSLAGVANLSGGMFGIFLAGPIADRIGPQRTIVLVLAAMAVLQLAMAAAGPLWSAPHVFASYKVVYILLFVLLSVSVYALAMRTSLPAVAATQFSIFMAILNLGTSFGSKLFASVKPAFDYEGVFVAGAICAFLAALMFRRRPARGD